MTAGAMTSLVAVSAATVEADTLTVEKRDLALRNWDANGFKVAHLADLHVDSATEAEHTANAFRLAMAENPDLIVIPGDFITLGQKPSRTLIHRGLEPLRDAKCPVLGTLGNHDYDTRSVTKMPEILRNSPVRLLRNESVEVSGITVAGVDDAIAGRHDLRFLEGNSFSKSTLALFHEPDYVDLMPTFVSLQLSGHSHGRQICLPGGIPVHTPRGANKYVVGYYPDTRIPLYVTRGIGTSGPRWRLFCRPEITILTLNAA